MRVFASFRSVSRNDTDCFHVAVDDFAEGYLFRFYAIDKFATIHLALNRTRSAFGFCLGWKALNFDWITSSPDTCLPACALLTERCHRCSWVG